MSDRQAEKIPPAILVLKEVIRDYRAVNDPAGLGALLFSLEQCLSGEKYTPPKTGGELNTFNRLLAAAKRGIESYEKMSERGRKGAAATNALKQTQTAQAANPSPSGGRPPAPVRQTGTPQAHTSGGERRGGVKSIGECFDMAAMFGGAGGGIADRITAEPVRAALEITGEPSGGIAENTLKKYLRTKGRNAFCDTLFAFHSEIKNGEDVGNRGAALNARLKALPDVPAGR